MAARDEIELDIEGYLRRHERKSLLRFITCGSVDDGKSTLIGRLLYDTKLLYEDHLAAMQADSRKWGTQGEGLDFALLVDGLAAEREQGITIDVAYRFFSTDRRKFIVADTPGHEQYTRNMVTGASTADAAVLMVDARKGVLTQTRRHSYLAWLMGIQHFVVAVNKMDLVGYGEARYRAITADYLAFAGELGIAGVTFVPMSALRGENVAERSANMPWHEGPTLLEFLEGVEVEDEQTTKPFRMPVQWVNRPNHDFRGFAGTIASGRVRPGDRLRVLPSGQTAAVARIVTAAGDLAVARAGQAVILTLAREVDVSRGDVLAQADAPAEVASQFETTIVWMHEEPLQPGRQYLMKIGTTTVPASVMQVKHQVNVNTLERTAARTLQLNAIGVCTLNVDRAIAFDGYQQNRETGGYVLIDRLSNATVGAGMLHFALRRSHNIHVQHLDVDKHARRQLNGHGSCAVWFTGLSGSGKSTIANRVEQLLHAMGVRTYLLDGDNVRHGLNKDLGFTETDRIENIRRVAEVTRLMVDAGVVVLTAFISPFARDRAMARALLGEGEFLEVHVDVPLEVARQRDPKGLYRKALRGELKNFTGIDAPYEAPTTPELHIPAAEIDVDEAAERVVELLSRAGCLGS